MSAPANTLNRMILSRPRRGGPWQRFGSPYLVQDDIDAAGLEDDMRAFAALNPDEEFRIAWGRFPAEC